MALFHTTVLDNQIKALPTVDTASGSIATFDTDMTENLVKCVCEVASGASEINVVATGVNLCGGDLLLANAQSYLPSGTADLVNKTFDYTASAATTDDEAFTTGITFKENTSYTVILTISKSNNNASCNMRIRYTDGTNLDFVFPSAPTIDEKYTLVFTSSNEKTILDIRKSNVSGRSKIYCDECGVFEGTLTADDFQPFGSYHNIPFGEALSGDGSFDVLSGILTRSDDTTKQLSANYIQTLNGLNNIWCDTGDTEVKYLLTVGKAIS